MKKVRTNIPLSKLQQNKGQVEWLPKNPRKWTDYDLQRTVDSLVEDPDYLEERPLLVVESGDKFVIFAGNLRRQAAPKAGLKELPCVIHYPVTDEDKETVKRRAMKDNGQFGSWDMAALESGEWGSASQTVAWGGPAWSNTSPAQSSEEAPIDGAENLPPELQGQDINPDDLPKITGDDEVAMERVIIVFPKERTADMAQLLGIPSIDKVVYNISELLPEA